MPTRNLNFYKPESLVKIVSEVTCPKQSKKNYPYSLIVFDTVSSSRDEPNEFIHKLTVYFEKNNNKLVETFEDSFTEDYKTSDSEEVTKDLYGLLNDYPFLNKDKYSLNLDKNKITIDLR